MDDTTLGGRCKDDSAYEVPELECFLIHTFGALVAPKMRGVSGVCLLSWLGAASSQVTLGNANTLQRVDYVYSPQRGPAHRGGGVFSGIVPGLALVAGSSALLWWNEGRTARQEHLLRTARRELVGSFGGDEPEDPANNGKLVHLHGSIESRGVNDPMFSISRPHALRLQRRAEAFQWVEHERTEETRVSESTVKRTRTYSYSTAWSGSAVDSGRFQDCATYLLTYLLTHSRTYLLTYVRTY